MLYNGEQVGDGQGPECDVAVDPIDGTTLMAKGMPNAIAVMAVADRGAMYDPSAVFYMEKLATGPAAADVVDITAPVAENIRRVAKAKKSSRRRRHRLHPRPAAPRAAGRRRSARPAPASSSSPTATSPARSRPPARAPASTCCSASAARRRASSPPARSSAWAAPSRAGSGRRTTRSGRRPSTPATTSTACCTSTTSSAATSSSSPPASPTASCCAASSTAPGGCTTQSLVMRSRSGTIRSIDSLHSLEKLRAYSAVPFDRNEAAEQQPVPAARPAAPSRAPQRLALDCRPAARLRSSQVAEDGAPVDDDQRGAREPLHRRQLDLAVAEHGPPLELGVHALGDDHVDVAEHGAEVEVDRGRRRCAARAGRSGRRRTPWTPARGAPPTLSLMSPKTLDTLLRRAGPDDLGRRAAAVGRSATSSVELGRGHRGVGGAGPLAELVEVDPALAERRLQPGDRPPPGRRRRRGRPAGGPGLRRRTRSGRSRTGARRYAGPARPSGRRRNGQLSAGRRPCRRPCRPRRRPDARRRCRRRARRASPRRLARTGRRRPPCRRRSSPAA